jgi:preprotein translocase subunit SecG
VFGFFVVIHVLICIALVLIVLLQAGRGGGLSGAFGGAGGTAQTLFGGRGAATFLTKTTQWLAAGFMVMSILLAVLSSRAQTTGGEAGLLQERARQRAGQAQLPPSTNAFDPATADTGAAGAAPTPGSQSGAPVPPAPVEAP